MFAAPTAPKTNPTVKLDQVMLRSEPHILAGLHQYMLSD